MKRRMRSHDDAGNVSVLTLGWIVLALLALVVMAAATQVHIDRMRLASLADETALAVSQTVSADGYLALDANAGARRATGHAVAADWLASDPRPWASEVVILEVSETSDGTSAVWLGRTVAPLFSVEAIGPLNLGIDLAVEGRARAG